MQKRISEALTHYLGRLAGEGSPIKVAMAGTVSLANYLGAAWALVPNLYQVAVALLMLDWITGTAKAWLTRTTNSNAGVRGIVKSTFYLAFLIVCDLGGKMGGQAMVWLPLFAFAAVGHTETTSVLENFRDIAKHYKIRIPLLDLAIRILRVKKAEQVAELIQQVRTGPLGQLLKESNHEQGRSNQGEQEREAGVSVDRDPLFGDESGRDDAERGQGSPR